MIRLDPALERLARVTWYIGGLRVYAIRETREYLLYRTDKKPDQFQLLFIGPIDKIRQVRDRLAQEAKVLPDAYGNVSTAGAFYTFAESLDGPDQSDEPAALDILFRADYRGLPSQMATLEWDLNGKRAGLFAADTTNEREELIDRVNQEIGNEGGKVTIREHETGNVLVVYEKQGPIAPPAQPPEPVKTIEYAVASFASKRPTNKFTAPENLSSVELYKAAAEALGPMLNLDGMKWVVLSTGEGKRITLKPPAKYHARYNGDGAPVLFESSHGSEDGLFAEARKLVPGEGQIQVMGEPGSILLAGHWRTER